MAQDNHSRGDICCSVKQTFEAKESVYLLGLYVGVAWSLEKAAFGKDRHSMRTKIQHAYSLYTVIPELFDSFFRLALT